MHNNIMAAGSKDRPPMLGPGRYSQWHSRFLRYLDTKSNGEYLRKCIFEGPYMPTNVLIAAVEAAEKKDSSQQGLEFLFSPLLEEYYNPTYGLTEENNNDQAPNASFQEAEFINPFCTRVQEIGESSSRNIDNTDVHSFQPQSHDF
ncbi:hypothetical protein Tco_1221794 [Tanacetum coccineum]